VVFEGVEEVVGLDFTGAVEGAVEVAVEVFVGVGADDFAGEVALF